MCVAKATLALVFFCVTILGFTMVSQTSGQRTDGMIPTRWYALLFEGSGGFGHQEIDLIFNATGIVCKVTKKPWMTARMLRMYHPPSTPERTLIRARSMVEGLMEANGRRAEQMGLSAAPKKKSRHKSPSAPSAVAMPSPSMASSSTFNPFAAWMSTFGPMMMPMMMMNDPNFQQAMQQHATQGGPDRRRRRERSPSSSEESGVNSPDEDEEGADPAIAGSGYNIQL